jgi:hypothetical protein
MSSGGCEAGRPLRAVTHASGARAICAADGSARPPQPGSASLSVGGVRSGECDASAQARDAAQSGPVWPMQKPVTGHRSGPRRSMSITKLKTPGWSRRAGRTARRRTDEVSRTGHHRMLTGGDPDADDAAAPSLARRGTDSFAHSRSRRALPGSPRAATARCLPGSVPGGARDPFPGSRGSVPGGSPEIRSRGRSGAEGPGCAMPV